MRPPVATIASVAALIGIAVAIAPADSAPVALTPAVADVLAVADEILSRASLDEALGATPVAVLGKVAVDGALDDGARLRAVRTLGRYPSPESRAVLDQVLTTRGRCEAAGASATGTDVLFIRAALEALGAIGDPEDVARIVPCLQAKSRDLRVAAARALRDLGASTAICPLQRQGDVETVPQVQSAISEALRRWPAQICPRPPAGPSPTAE